MNIHEKIKLIIILFLIIILNVYITCKREKKEGFMNKVMKKIKKEFQKFGDQIMKTIFQGPVKLIPIKAIRNGLLGEMKGKSGINMIFALAFGIVKLIFAILIMVPLIILMLKVFIIVAIVMFIVGIIRLLFSFFRKPKTDPIETIPVASAMAGVNGNTGSSGEKIMETTLDEVVGTNIDKDIEKSKQENNATIKNNSTIKNNATKNASLSK